MSLLSSLKNQKKIEKEEINKIIETRFKNNSIQRLEINCGKRSDFYGNVELTIDIFKSEYKKAIDLQQNIIDKMAKEYKVNQNDDKLDRLLNLTAIDFKEKIDFTKNLLENLLIELKNKENKIENKFEKKEDDFKNLEKINTLIKNIELLKNMDIEIAFRNIEIFKDFEYNKIENNLKLYKEKKDEIINNYEDCINFIYKNGKINISSGKIYTVINETIKKLDEEISNSFKKLDEVEKFNSNRSASIMVTNRSMKDVEEKMVNSINKILKDMEFSKEIDGLKEIYNEFSNEIEQKINNKYETPEKFNRHQEIEKLEKENDITFRENKKVNYRKY